MPKLIVANGRVGFGSSNPGAIPSAQSTQATLAHERDCQHQNHGTYDRDNKAVCNRTTKVNREVRRVEEPITQERAYETNEGVADDPISAPTQEKSGEPSGHSTDYKDHHDRFGFNDTLQSYCWGASMPLLKLMQEFVSDEDVLIASWLRCFGQILARGRGDYVFTEPVLAITLTLCRKLS